jgi:6-phosphogluconolactonase
MFRKLLVTSVMLAISLFGAAPAFAKTASQAVQPGAVYIMDNSPEGNQVLVYSRNAQGSLDFSGSYPTGGNGSGIGVTVPADPLGSQDSLLLSSDNQWLFAVNAGSSTVSVFKVLAQGLRLTDTVASGGNYPVSLAFQNRLLYVLNAAGDGNIAGFRLTARGKLNAVEGSTRDLHAATPSDGSQPQILESPSQVGFTPVGNFLVIIDKGGVSGVGKILTFAMEQDGLPALDPVTTTTANPVPFAFTFDLFGHLVVVDASAGSITSYNVNGDGSLSEISEVTNGQQAVCWITSNPAKGLIFTDNTGSGTISALLADKSGTLTLLGKDGYSASTGAGTAPLDMGITRDGRFIYSLETGVGQIGVTRVNADHSLTFIGPFGDFPAISGFAGMAVK